MPSILIANGPNLNLLGRREPEVYGHTTLAEIEAQCAERAESFGIDLEFRQSNTEGDLVTWMQQANLHHDGVILNAAAYTHTSIALRDALASIAIPVIEVHLSNIYQREAFRHHSHISPVASGVICGLGPLGYVLAVDAIAALIEEE